mmetsp:Transcript_35804/g.72982  ORF Transcript_35804/g.72982 Transcript_35804/m.72982 type:complete len:92 (-) Transcript_35804:265-540(-)
MPPIIVRCLAEKDGSFSSSEETSLVSFFRFKNTMLVCWSNARGTIIAIGQSKCKAKRYSTNKSASDSEKGGFIGRLSISLQLRKLLHTLAA